MRSLVLLVALMGCCATNFVRDGSFERARDGVSPFWVLKSSGRNLVCSLRDCDGAGTYSPGPRTGRYFVWMEGFGYKTGAGALSQSVPVPAGLPLLLRFYLQVNTTGANAASMSVLVDGRNVASFRGEDCAYFPRYAPFEKRIEPARGPLVELMFRYETRGNVDYNLTHFYFDDVSLTISE